MGSITIWFHLSAALAAIILGLANLLLSKGTGLHRFLGWLWIGLMVCATLSSLLIRQVHPGGAWSWLHGLTIYTLLTMASAMVAIGQGNVRRHGNCMKGTMVGAIAAGTAALAPGRFLSEVLGY